MNKHICCIENIHFSYCVKVMNNSEFLLRIASFNYFPYHMFKSYGVNVAMEGINGIILQNIAKSMKISYELVKETDSTWGLRQEDGNWTGVLGMAIRGEVHMTGIPTNPTDEKMEFSHQTSGLYPVLFMILNGRQNIYLHNPFSFVNTFNFEIYTVLFAYILVVAITLSIAEQSNQRAFYEEKPRKQILWNSIYQYFWALLSTALSEAMSLRYPANISSRLLLSVWWLNIFVLTHSFSGQMKAVQLVKEEMPRIESLRDLSYRPKIIPYIPRDSAVVHSLKTSPLKHVQLVWQNTLKHKSHITPKNLVSLATLTAVLNGNAVVITSRPALAIKAQQMCDSMSMGQFYLSKEPTFSFFAVMHVNKKTPEIIKTGIDKRIIWMRDSGLMAKWYEAISGYWDSCGKTEFDSALQLSELVGILYVWIIGLGCSIASLAVENIVYSYQQRCP